MPAAEREKVIRSVWENIGRPRWNDDVHGKGASLFVPISQDMQAVRPGQPINPPEQLEFRLLSPSMSGHPRPAIVCDGVIVEEWPVPYAIELCVDRIPQPKVFDRRIVREWPLHDVIQRAKASLSVWPPNGIIFEGDTELDVTQLGLHAVFVRVVELSTNRIVFQTSLAEVDYRPNREPPDL
jgi:hypothetical protein